MPFLSVLFAEPADKISDVLRNALADDIVIHGAQLLPDPGLDLSAQASLRLVRLVDWPAHGVPGMRLVRIRFALIRCYRFKTSFTVLHSVIFPPFAHLPNPYTHRLTC